MIIPIELRFKADKDSKSAFLTNKTIKSHDVNSVEFHITIEGLELTDNHTAKILSIFHSSKSQVNTDCEIVDGKIIDKETHLFIRDDFTYDTETEIGLDVEPAQGLYKPKWNGEKWVEGATQEEIDELTKPQTHEPTELERLDNLENTILMLLMKGG